MAPKKEKIFKVVRNSFAVAFWAALVIVCLVNKDRITVDSIVAFSPDNRILAVLVMLALFAVKSVSVFIYCGLLYAASGILFPFPLAVLVNNLGNVLMATIPFWIGKKAGAGLVGELTAKHPKLAFMKEIPNKNTFFMSFFVRIIGILPSDIIGAYLGATGISYKRYITGTLLGMFPQTVTFCLMGMKINDPGSPEFIVSLILEIALIVVSTTAYAIWMKRIKKNPAATPSENNQQINRHS